MEFCFFALPPPFLEGGKMQGLRDPGRNFPMERKKRILVFGHRNPDTDSIVSAIATSVRGKTHSR